MNLTQFTDIDKAAKWFQEQPEAEINRMVAEADGCIIKEVEDDVYCVCDVWKHGHIPPQESPCHLKPYATSVDAMLEVVKSVGFNHRRIIEVPFEGGQCCVNCWKYIEGVHNEHVITPWIKGKHREALALAFAVCWYKRLEVE